MPVRDVLVAISPPLLWALTYALAKPGLAHFPPLFFTAVVYTIAAVLLWRPKERSKTPLPALIVIATLGGTVQSALVFGALADMPASLASLAVQLQVPFAVLAASAICQERLSIRRLAGILVAFTGVALASGALGAGDVNTYPMLLMTLGTMSWGIAQALIRRYGRDPGNIVIGSITRYAAPMLFCLSAVFETGQFSSLRTADTSQWLSAIVLAVGGFVVAYRIWYSLMRRYRVDQVTPFALLMPPFGLLAGWLLLGETIGFREVAGACVIVSGLWVIVQAPITHRETPSS